MRIVLSKISATVLITLSAFLNVWADVVPDGASAVAPGMKPYFRQPTLMPGQAVDGTVAATDLVSLDGRAIDCYQIHTEPKSRWVITMESTAFPPYIMLSVGETCESALSSESVANTGDAIIKEDANILNSRSADVPVGQYPPNAFGLYDVHGNDPEWVQDCLVDGGYFGVPTDGSAMESETCVRILRGGAFRSEPVHVRSAARFPVKSFEAAAIRVTRALD